LLEVRENRGEITGALERRTGRRTEGHTHLVGDDAGQGRLPEARRAAEQQVVAGLPAPSRSLDQERELLLDVLLADELGERARPERHIVGDIVGAELGLDHPLVGFGDVHRAVRRFLAHARPTFRSASRSISSTGRSPLPCNAAIASRASCAERPSARRASRTSASGPAGTSASPPMRSLRSRTTRWATLLPTPRTIVSPAAAPPPTARRR